jgi:hypothetical protein
MAAVLFLTAALQGCGFYHERQAFWHTVEYVDHCDPRGDCSTGKLP